MTVTDGHNSKITAYVLSCWILAAFGGLMFGYDIGISGTNSIDMSVYQQLIVAILQ